MVEMMASVVLFLLLSLIALILVMAIVSLIIWFYYALVCTL